jgi:hypothetical protein
MGSAECIIGEGEYEKVTVDLFDFFGMRRSKACYASSSGKEGIAE